MNAIIKDDEVDFSDLDDLDSAPTAKSSKPEYKEPCLRCGGTGRYHRPTQYGTVCFLCDGKGYKVYKTKPEQRAKNRARAAKKRQEEQAAKLAAKRAKFEAFKVEHAPAYEWLFKNKGWSDFACSLYNGLCQYGSLTEGQLAAVYRSVEKSKEREEQAKKEAADIGGAGFEKLLQGFASAKASGLKRPRLTIDRLVFSLAPDSGKNAGFLYVKVSGEYAGKVDPKGKFYKSYAATADDVALIERVGKDPHGEAVAHGKRTGNCACCGRELSDPVSIANGIGPICANKWDW